MTCFCVSLTLAASAAASDYVILVGGLGGEPKYSDEFAKAVTATRASLIKGGYGADHIRTLLEKAGPLSSGGGAEAAQSTLTNIRSEFERLRTEVSEADTLLLILVGHGQSDYQEPRFNLPGSDLTGHGLVELLSAIPCKDQRLILLFSCSGHFSEILSSPTRTIIASTDGPRQVYHTVTLPYFLKALDNNGADFNGDNKISSLEMLDYLSEQVKEHFAAAGNLQIEMPSLDDNGDGKITARADGLDAGDGERAGVTILLPAPGRASTAGQTPKEETGKK
ncbi:MAG: hypothetical protein HZB26_15780 [Candidatus Hydrogenedentes bacterium]|nr:hypothetical protein [Candidatus Hydrogenedentota bacterium]